jgi:hypothetical protein
MEIDVNDWDEITISLVLHDFFGPDGSPRASTFRARVITPDAGSSLLLLAISGAAHFGYSHWH